MAVVYAVFQIRGLNSSRDQSMRSTSFMSKGQGNQRDCGVANKAASNVHTTNVISQLQYFAAGRLSSYVCFPSAPKLVT
jgi:hypothetical protein